jgi:sortase (surface protein transpeptidase)
MRAAAPVRPPLTCIGVLAALWLALAGCSAAGGGQHPAAARSAAVRPSPTASVMIQTTPITRSLDLTGAPPAPETSGGGTAPAPTRLAIPVLKVDTAVVRLGLNSDNTIEVPSDPNQVGWYTNGPSPGEQGPAVILGHLDSVIGPAVFYRLSSLRAGSQVVVSRDDGSAATFVVQRVASFPVDSFPTGEVYGATTDPELRLITCGGQYSLVQRRYLQNVVVFAVLAK